MQEQTATRINYCPRPLAGITCRQLACRPPAAPAGRRLRGARLRWEPARRRGARAEPCWAAGLWPSSEGKGKQERKRGNVRGNCRCSMLSAPQSPIKSVLLVSCSQSSKRAGRAVRHTGFLPSPRITPASASPLCAEPRDESSEALRADSQKSNFLCVCPKGQHCPNGCCEGARNPPAKYTWDERSKRLC